MNKSNYARRFSFGRRASDARTVLNVPVDDAQRLADDIGRLVREMPASKEYFEEALKKLQQDGYFLVVKNVE